MQQALVAAISQGAPLYNAGDVAGYDHGPAPAFFGSVWGWHIGFGRSSMQSTRCALSVRGGLRCAALYRTTAQRLLQQAPDGCSWAATLSSGLAEAAAAADADQAAWALRRAFDSLLAAAAAPSCSTTLLPSSGGGEPAVLFDFSTHVPAAWRPINDTVMGGASSSAFTHSAHEYAPPVLCGS
jgi:hypothetical protein